MLRSFLRASRCLAQKRINTRTFSVFRTNLVRLSQPSCRCSIIRNLSSPSNIESAEHVDQAVFEDICNETLESLCEYFEEIIDQANHLKGADVTFSDGVLTVHLGPDHGTYVINRQTPNKQIWLSSPISGPKRYDLILKNGGYWIYKHDGIPLHRLLQDEISKIINNVDFNSCNHSVL